MSDPVKDLFSDHADRYAKYRPVYPNELFEFIFQYVDKKEAALDCGTGNGQAAGVLAGYFKEVQAIDISEKQIKNAVKRPNLHYHICQAEKTPFADNSFDLITCATAIHWFQFDDFFREIKRVGKNNSVFACWGYSVLRTDHAEINDLMDHFYTHTIHQYWDTERKYVDEEYRTIPFPFEEIRNQGFARSLTWDLTLLEGYLNTWSAVQHYIKIHTQNPVNKLMDEMRSKLQEGIQLNITFPIFMRMGFIRK